MVAQITPLSDPPSRADPENFVERSDQFMSELPVFAIEANVLATEVNANATGAAAAVSETTAIKTAAVSETTAIKTAAVSETTAIKTAAVSETTAIKTAAALSASNALASEGAAHDSKLASAASAGAADASRIAASKLNLGAKSAPPTLDNQGETLLAGSTYYDTTLGKWRVWTGAAWGDGISAVAGVASINGLTGDVSIASTSLQGATEIYVNQLVPYTINDFDSFSAYTATVSAGSVSLTGATVTFVTPAVPGPVTLTVTKDGVARAIELAVLAAGVAAPTITSPASGATDIKGPAITITASAFAWLGVADTHLDTDWELWTGPERTGTLVASSLADAANKTSWTTTVAVATTYYPVARYRGTANGASAWSATSSFTTAAEFNDYIPTPAPTPANYGDPFEGGFYMGMFWNQIAQSTTSKTLATGTQVFTVPDMTAVPLVYAGQQLEVRSRANPANKFIGTVIGAIGTSLTLNVSSIGGSGTFSDWSVMSRFRHIEAPKASGEHAGIAIKNANTALPTACQTLTEGWEATLAMVAAGDATTYPAAHWARSLVIGGKNDWHIPARDVRELSWRNGKPTTDANYVAADRPAASTFNYMNNGSYGDTANTQGLNNNSVPAGAAYTTSVPAQTAATAFRTGGAEAFEYGSAYYWSSSDYNATLAWSQYWYSSFPGRQGYGSKTGTYRVRAARRSII